MGSFVYLLLALRRRPFLEQRGKVVFSLVSLAYSLQYLAEEARFRLKDK